MSGAAIRVEGCGSPDGWKRRRLGGAAPDRPGQTGAGREAPDFSGRQCGLATLAMAEAGGMALSAETWGARCELRCRREAIRW